MGSHQRESIIRGAGSGVLDQLVDQRERIEVLTVRLSAGAVHEPDLRQLAWRQCERRQRLLATVGTAAVDEFSELVGAPQCGDEILSSRRRIVHVCKGEAVGVELWRGL